MMARVAITIFTLGALYGIYALGPPVWWRIQATIIKPFEDPSFEVLDDDPFAAAFIEQHRDTVHKKRGAGSQQPAAASDPAGVKAPVTAAAKPAASPPPPSTPAPFPPPKEVIPEQYPLTRERIQPLLQDGYIMVTWANEHYLDFARTWVASMRRVGITGYLVGAMDDDMLRALVRLDINTWRMNTGITKADLGWGSQNFHKMGRSKIALIQQFMSFEGITLVISDIDTVWMRNPLPFFSRYAQADILTSSDELHPSVSKEELERWPVAAAAFNIGIMMFRPKSREFVNQWVESLKDPKMWDQTAFNDIVRQGAAASGPDGLFKGYHGKLTVGILPVAQFASGHVFFVQRKHEEFGLQPYVAHATFQYSGTPGKRHRFREAMLFEDEPAYYDPPRGFIALRLDIPRALWDGASGKNSQGSMTAEKLATHFALVNHQLLYVRAAIALAQLTGRILVLPPIWCELDKYWAPLHNGNIPGSEFRKPFICPMDHVLDIEGGWFPRKLEDEFGPQVEWREYSFLQNPRTPARVNQSRLAVTVCEQGGAGCSDGSGPGTITEGQLRLAPGLDSTKLAAALKGTDSYRILDISGITRMWPAFREDGGWFTDPEQHRRFVQRLRHMTSVVCCLQTNPGWIWYDLMWDVPHKDRFGRVFDTWHIKLGDQDQRAQRRLLALEGATEGGQSPASFLYHMQQEAMFGLP